MIPARCLLSPPNRETTSETFRDVQDCVRTGNVLRINLSKYWLASSPCWFFSFFGFSFSSELSRELYKSVTLNTNSGCKKRALLHDCFPLPSHSRLVLVFANWCPLSSTGFVYKSRVIGQDSEQESAKFRRSSNPSSYSPPRPGTALFSMCFPAAWTKGLSSHRKVWAFSTRELQNDKSTLFCHAKLAAAFISSWESSGLPSVFVSCPFNNSLQDKPGHWEQKTRKIWQFWRTKFAVK